jgi:hypothetical protein
MSVYIFVGPTLAAHEVHDNLPEATCLPPVSQGDVYRVTQLRPTVVGIIDGRFERTPAVWHKEILWALAKGIHVFGAASMGALRAAELSVFGMEGVGAIFNAYMSGDITDDDEVAVAEGVQGSEFVSLSEAMVNIRATFSEAVRQGLINRQTERHLLGIAKQLFYPERVYPAIIAKAAEVSTDPHELVALADWLPRHRINQKREDALLMLRVIADRLAQGLPPKVVDYEFQYTEVWHQLVLAAGIAPSENMVSANVATSTNGVTSDRLLDEARLEGVSYISARREALFRFLGLNYAQQQGVAADDEAIRRAAFRFREARGLLEQGDHERWMRENGLTREGFLRLMANEALLEWSTFAAEPNLVPHLVDYLIESAEYAPLAARAQEKQRVLAERGISDAYLAQLDVTEEALFDWFIDQRLAGKRIGDIDAYAKFFGYRFKQDFVRALLREYYFSQVVSDASAV